MTQNPAVKSTWHIRPVFVSATAFVVSLPFNKKKKKRGGKIFSDADGWNTNTINTAIPVYDSVGLVQHRKTVL